MEQPLNSSPYYQLQSWETYYTQRYYCDDSSLFTNDLHNFFTNYALPKEIILLIMEYLDPISAFRCRAVSKWWYAAGGNLRRPLCAYPKIHLVSFKLPAGLPRTASFIFFDQIHHRFLVIEEVTESSSVTVTLANRNGDRMDSQRIEVPPGTHLNNYWKVESQTLVLADDSVTLGVFGFRSESPKLRLILGTSRTDLMERIYCFPAIPRELLNKGPATSYQQSFHSYKNRVLVSFPGSIHVLQFNAQTGQYTVVFTADGTFTDPACAEREWVVLSSKSRFGRRYSFLNMETFVQHRLLNFISSGCAYFVKDGLVYLSDSLSKFSHRYKTTVICLRTQKIVREWIHSTKQIAPSFLQRLSMVDEERFSPYYFEGRTS